MYKKKGITLIALVITIILMLILATVTISMTVNGGLFNYAGDTIKNTEIASEKETISQASIIAKGMSKTGRVTVEELQKQINKITNENTAITMDNGDTIVVKFNKNDRYYEVDSKGKIEGPKELIKENYAGDITKGGVYNGSEQKPFQIACIEDLVVFSIMTNGGNKNLDLASSRFTDQYVELTRTLDFKSIFSYKDYTSTIYGDLNTDGKIEDIRTELTKTDEGCIGFQPITSFCGTFNGKGNTIENIYQCSDLARGLFVNAQDALFIRKIENLNLSGNITSTNGNASGFGGAEIISNCKNYVNVTGYNVVGGISAWACTLAIDCENYGNIHKTGGWYQYSAVGGISGIGRVCTIKNCTNYGKVTGNSNCAGILGSINEQSEGETQIINCINRGEADTGIFSYAHYGEMNIINCCNLGKTTKTGIADRVKDTVIKNTYNAGISDNAIVGSVRSGTVNVTNTYYDKTKSSKVGAITDGIEAMDEEDMKNNESFVQTLNNNIGTNTEWKRWKIGKDGWPTFE